MTSRPRLSTGKIRAFVDGGSWRFRKPDVEEEARRRGIGSDPELSLSDLNLSSTGGADDGGLDFNLSDFQIGTVPPDLAPESIEVNRPVPSDHDLLIDDRTSPPAPGSGSSSTIIGMHGKPGKQPSDSDVRLVPDDAKGASDSDVRLASPAPGDSDVTLAGDFGSSAEVKPIAGPDPAVTIELSQPGLGSSAETRKVSDSDSDFELTPSSVIDAPGPNRAATSS